MKIARALMIDGKPVCCWLFMYRVKDERAGREGRQEYLVQVQAFTLDHAMKRVKEYADTLHKSDLPNRDFIMIEELDPEHDVGALGHFLPLLPFGSSFVAGSRRLN